ncbi:MAG: hypothetical protein ACK4E3_10720 [Brevundimonas sp.]|uniref:hypothetical protein n=1 Tax=Brevundimonas sp. TaxID=1871086 RepID=UPI00391D9433
MSESAKARSRLFPMGIIVTLMLQSALALMWAGGAAARLASVEARIDEQRLVAERLARLEEQGLATRAAVERIERRLDSPGRTP